jgi:hypothetical protein
MDLDVGESGVIVHGGVQEVIPQSSSTIGTGPRPPAPKTPPAARRDPAELLYVHMHQLPGVGSFVSADHPASGSVHPRKAMEPVAPEDAVDRGAGMAQGPPQTMRAVLCPPSGRQDPVHLAGL